MTIPVIVQAAASLVLVLSFGILREQRLRGTLPLMRWHLAATALAAGSSAFGMPTAGTWLPAAACLVTLTVAWRIGGALERLDARTGDEASRPASMASIPLIAGGLGLTALAVLAVTAMPGAGRQAIALALAVTLLGLLSASRPGSPALFLARFAALGDGLILLGCSSAPVLLAGSALLTPAVLLVAIATIGRAGGLPADDGETRR